MSEKKNKRKSASYKRLQRRNIVLGVLAILILVIICFFTPVFSISEVTVTGNKILSAEAIIEASGIEPGDNFLFINKSKSEKAINALGYVDKVEVKRKFFTRIELRVTEASEVAYVAFSGNYVGIDSEGKVLSLRKSTGFKPAKAVISGLEISKVVKGDILIPKDEEKFALAKTLLANLESKGMLPDTTKIDIRKEDNISFTLNTKTKVVLGDSSEIDYKLEYARVVMEKQGSVRGGKLDISDTSSVIYQPDEGSKKE